MVSHIPTTIATITFCAVTAVAVALAQDNELKPCPDSPNCVSSLADDPSHQVDPFQLAAQHRDTGWSAVRQAVSEQPRTTVIVATDAYLHAECRSRVFGFVDDLELSLAPDGETISVRSASRLGYADFGVNRRRVEKLRSLLIARGILK